MTRKSFGWPARLKPNTLMIFAISIAAILLMLVGGDFFRASKDGDYMRAGLDSEQIRKEGLLLYNENCLECHGVHGRGTSFGPALTNKLYQTPLFKDKAFAQAIIYGVDEHHWNYGPMKPITELSQTHIAMITAYIRQVQNAHLHPKN